MPDLKPHIEERLRTDPIAWFITVRADGRPHVVAVWFFWDGETILVFSQPGTQKLRNLQHNTNVALALDGTNGGDDVIVVEGKAELLAVSPLSMATPAFIQKYGASMQGMNTAPEQLAAEYSQVIRVMPTRFRG